MPKTKKLHKQIERKIETLHQLINKINEVQAINPDDPETWDPDTLYNLIELLKETQQLLEDKKAQRELDELGNPLILEEGLCSLVDKYQSEEEEE